MTEHTAQALVIVDMQVDYFNDGELERCRDDLVAACNTLFERATAAGAPVVEVRTEHRPDRSTWALNMREDDSGMVIEGTPGVDPVPGLRTEGALRVVKTRDSAFFRTDLEDLLRSRGVESIALVGVSTESCIATTAADAYARDLRVVLVDEAVASIDPGLNRRTQEQLEQQYRQPTVRLDDVAFDAPGRAAVSA
ncbi:isochorismatase family cysteine hydrolase [Aeromicrobium sp. NPDC092404]|uniref:cysteine hydrolase family protein n=1 Tax=Aeromicrobium sp. NPDC092404 TaxID=3154976 RepID=UPI00343538CE